MLSRFLVIAALSFFLSIPAHAQFGRTQPVYDVVDTPISAVSGKTLSLDQVRSIIVQATKARGWIVQEVAPNHLVATITPRSHMAAVDITFTTKTFSIKYKNSDNLLYDGKEIHRNYNKWVKLLEDDINRQLNIH